MEHIHQIHFLMIQEINDRNMSRRLIKNNKYYLIKTIVKNINQVLDKKCRIILNKLDVNKVVYIANQTWSIKHMNKISEKTFALFCFQGIYSICYHDTEPIYNLFTDEKYETANTVVHNLASLLLYDKYITFEEFRDIRDKIMSKETAVNI
jgi:hypothetical protein